TDFDVGVCHGRRGRDGGTCGGEQISRLTHSQKKFIQKPTRIKNTRKENIMAGKPDSTVKTIVLVHGGFVDGSGWEDVYKILKREGYNVSIVQNPTISLEDDVAVTKRVLATQSGP